MNKDELIREIEKAYTKKKELCSIIEKHNDIFILGNGGSSSIASHIAQDYTKVLLKRAMTFSDPSRLTCYINDYGMENAYAKFLEDFVDFNTSALVILISSSGNSQNIINAAKWCKERKVSTIILTGFKENNMLRYMTLNPLDFPSNLLSLWVDSCDYGVVECVHQIFLHSVLGAD